MINYSNKIYPTSITFTENKHDIVHFESGSFEIRGKIQKDVLSSVSFVLTEQQYSDFEDFYASINFGIDNFITDWRGKEEEYSFESDTDFKYESVSTDYNIISFKVFIIKSFCLNDTFDLISEVERNIDLLKGNTNYYADNVECSNITKALNIEIENNIKILKDEVTL